MKCCGECKHLTLEQKLKCKNKKSKYFNKVKTVNERCEEFDNIIERKEK